MGGVDALRKLLPPAAPTCPHQLARWVLRTTRSTQAYRDGGLRLPEHRGGHLVRSATGCVWTPGHAGVHRTGAGTEWS